MAGNTYTHEMGWKLPAIDELELAVGESGARGLPKRLVLVGRESSEAM